MNLDKANDLFHEIQAENEAREREKDNLREELKVNKATQAHIAQERRDKVANFKLELDLPEDEPIEPSSEQMMTEDVSSADAADTPSVDEVVPSSAQAVGLFMEETDEDLIPSAPKKKKKKKKQNWGCATGILYATLVLGISGILAYVAIAGVIDLLGLNKSDQKISVTIPIGSGTKEIADILHEEGIIDQPLIFRLYSRVVGADGTYQPHDQLDLSPNMGYGDLIDALSAEQIREEVTVTIVEGATIEEIAAILEEKKVCTKDDFFGALISGDYTEYTFLSSQPTEDDDAKYAHRVYDLEGYLFPDTYNFYTHSSAYSAICKMLDNFDNRLSTDLRAAIKAKGMTIDEAVILASIIQGEASNRVDMEKVSRVLYNRMENKDEFPLLQCDSTRDYITELLGTDEETAVRKAYDTYICKDLPVGAICNPGLDALTAAVKPTADKDILKCYYFATDYSTGVTYYSRTYSQHVAICKKYGIGVHA